MRSSEDKNFASSSKLENVWDDMADRPTGQLGSHRKHRLSLVVQSPVRRESLHLLLAKVLAECAIESYSSLDCVSQDRDGLILLCQSSIPHGVAKTREYIEAVKLKFPSVALLVMSDDDDIELASVVLRCGAKGYLMPSLGTAAFVAAIQLAMAGGVYAPTSLIEHWSCGQESVGGDQADNDPAVEDTVSSSEVVSSQAKPAVNVFTLRELDVIGRLQSGQPNKLIAYGLNMSESTVKVHMRNIMRKLGATNRTQVAFYVRGIKEPEHSQPFPSMVARKLSTSSSGRVTPSNGISTGEVNCAWTDALKATLEPRV